MFQALLETEGTKIVKQSLPKIAYNLVEGDKEVPKLSDMTKSTFSSTMEGQKLGIEQFLQFKENQQTKHLQTCIWLMHMII